MTEESVDEPLPDEYFRRMGYRRLCPAGSRGR